MASDQHATDTSVRYRLSQLAGLAPRLRDPNAMFGQWRGGQETERSDCLTMPWFAFSDFAREFSDVLYRSGWVLVGFDWDQWARTEEGRAMLSDPVAIGDANAAQ